MFTMATACYSHPAMIVSIMFSVVFHNHLGATSELDTKVPYATKYTPFKALAAKAGKAFQYVVAKSRQSDRQWRAHEQEQTTHIGLLPEKVQGRK